MLQHVWAMLQVLAVATADCSAVGGPDKMDVPLLPGTGPTGLPGCCLMSALLPGDVASSIQKLPTEGVYLFVATEKIGSLTRPLTELQQHLQCLWLAARFEEGCVACAKDKGIALDAGVDGGKVASHVATIQFEGPTVPA